MNISKELALASGMKTHVLVMSCKAKFNHISNSHPHKHAMNQFKQRLNSKVRNPLSKPFYAGEVLFRLLQNGSFLLSIHLIPGAVHHANAGIPL
jgi:hypothetical protein